MKIDELKKSTEPSNEVTLPIMTELNQLQKDIIKAQKQREIFEPALTNTPLWAFKTLLSILIKHHSKFSYENENNRY